jgi:glycine oxidase
MNTYEFDYIIVGQGLAGSILACLLRMEQKRVLLIDNGHRTAASMSAAGIINPVTGKRLNRPYLIDQLLEHAFAIYPRLERFLGASFFRRRKVLRLLQSEAEQRQWKTRLATGEYSKYVGSIDCPPFPGNGPWLGGFEITQAAQLDVPAFIRRTRSVLASEDVLLESQFSYEELAFSTQAVHWRQYSARAVIFCEGYKLNRNPFFKAIQLNPAKGELLTLRTPGFTDDRIIQRGKWLYRASADELKAGTTYSWDRLDETPTNAGRKEIEDSLRQFANIDYEVVDHTAGVRPVIRVDNRPVIGTHPDNNRIAIFNGLGSKGALQAPFAAVQLIGYLEGSQTIHQEFDVCRKSLWQRLSSD